MMRHTWCLSLLMSFYSAFICSAQLSTISITQQKNQTTLFLTVNGTFTHKLLLLSQPERVVLDLKGTQQAAMLKFPSLTHTVIRQIRTGRVDATTLRLVLDVTQKVQIRSSPWQSKEGNGIRVDLLYTNKPVISSSQAGPKAPTSSSIKHSSNVVQQVMPILANQPPVKVSNSPPKSLRDVVVVLDAGHGGKDSGARGPHRSNEKDVVLAITLKLKYLIDRQPGMRAVLTRTGDYYVGLRERMAIARKYNGDVFVAIHADAFNNPNSNGASVFALSQSGATSEAARWLAEKENYSELGGVNLGDLDDRNGMVRSVLIDLSQTATINAGLQMGTRVLNQLGSFTNLHNNRVEQARFMVLKSPDIPSILVETGFISNPREERNLTSSTYQMRLSQAIFQGIKGYFWENPPHNSRIEAMTSNKFHLVRAGETVPAVAARYQVSIKALQEVNHLHNKSQLRSGQKLVIPKSWA